MKVLLINGSRRESGCTHTALGIIKQQLSDNGIETVEVWVGDSKLYNSDGALDAKVEELSKIAEEIDGVVVGSPVYYASPSGEIMMFMDRFLGKAGAALRNKPAAAVASARRGGTTATVDVMNKYFMFNQMPIVSSTYWNMVHGNTPEEVLKDEEGVQIMRVLAKNMAWLLKCIEEGKKVGINAPEAEKPVRTNFIR